MWQMKVRDHGVAPSPRSSLGPMWAIINSSRESWISAMQGRAQHLGFQWKRVFFTHFEFDLIWVRF